MLRPNIDQYDYKLLEASVAIDAMAAIVDGVGDRLGPNRSVLRDALAQLQMAFVQLKQES